ncbi:MAG: CRISPR-associated protein Csx19 [Ignavibacteria bacterium]|nr:CRISPR-associated protein Csx19 [Ignavibacteria bacterium]
METNKSGLSLYKIASTAIGTEVIEDLSEINKIISEKSFVVAYLDYKVLIGKYIGASFMFYNNEQIEPKYIQRMRIFNENEELMLWRSEGKLKGRLRKDNEGDEVNVVDADQVLFGTIPNAINGFTRITEERGTELILPFKNLKVDNGKNRMKITTRNYVGFNEIHHATYVDCRFVGFKNNNTNLEI